MSKSSASTESYFKAVDKVITELPWEPSFHSTEAVVPLVVGEGVELRPVFGHNVMMSFVYMKPNSVAAIHAHPEEQMGTIIEGEYEFELNGVRRMCRVGDVYVVPPGVPHGARTYERGCIALDVFSPPRGGFREMWDAAVKAQVEREHGQAGSAQ